MGKYYVTRAFRQKGKEYKPGDEWTPQGTRRDLVILREGYVSKEPPAPRWKFWRRNG